MGQEEGSRSLVGTNKVPQCGDFWHVDLDLETRGREQMNPRPVLVVSTNKFNNGKTLAIACPGTNTNSGDPLHVEIPPSRELLVKGFIMTDQVRALDILARNGRYLCRCPEPLVAQVLHRLRVILLPKGFSL